MDDGEVAVVRFLTDADDWIVVDQHQMVPTKGKPSDWPDGANYPDKMGAVCRNDAAFAGMFEDCYICDNLVDGKTVRKPGSRTWALACLREEVIGDGSEELGGAEMKGKVLGIRDKTREVTIPAKDGEPEKTITEKDIVVVNMGFKNFFSALQGFAGRYGTVLDRDYWIKRSGSDQTTTYQIVPLDPIEIDGKRFDLRDPEFAARYATELDLEEVITERASDEFYGKFFDRRVTVTMDGKTEKAASNGNGTAASTPPPETDVSAERMAELANRVKGYGPQGGTPTEEARSSGSEATPTATGAMRDFS